MKKIALAAAVAASVSFLAATPAAAQDAVARIYYGDLDIASADGAKAFGERFEAGLNAVCTRPDIRDLKGMAAWSACRDSAHATALEQLARNGANVEAVSLLASN